MSDRPSDHKRRKPIAFPPWEQVRLKSSLPLRLGQKLDDKELAKRYSAAVFRGVRDVSHRSEIERLKGWTGRGADSILFRVMRAKIGDRAIGRAGALCLEVISDVYEEARERWRDH